MGPVSPIPEGKPSHEIAVRPSAESVVLASLRAQEWRVEQRGFDTLSIGFRLDPSSDWARRALHRPVTTQDDLAALTGKPCTTDDTGRPMPVSVTEKGNWTARLGWATVLGYPGFDLVRVECRPSALLARDPRTTALLPASRLPDAEQAARELVATLLGNRGFVVSTPPSVHRADLAVDLVQDGDLGIGRNALFALAQVRLPYWGQAKAHPARTSEGYLEGVSWASKSGQVQFRAYDKPFELRKRKHGDHPLAGEAGRWLRLERQFRPTSADKRLTIAELQDADLRSLWLGRWVPWLNEQERDVLVCGRTAAATEIARQVEAGGLSNARAQSLLGALTAWDEALPPQLYYGGDNRAAAQFRSVGIAYSREMPPLASFPVGSFLRLAASSWSESA